MVLNTAFNNISVISWRKLDYPEKTTDLPQVTDKPLSCNVVSNTPWHGQDSNKYQFNQNKTY